jgi:hypothetical protein
MTETEMLRGARYATAFFFQVAAWAMAVWYPLGLTVMLLWWAFTEDDPACFILMLAVIVPGFILTSWICSRIAKGLLKGRRWATVLASIMGAGAATAAFSSVLYKPDEALRYVSNGVGFVLWSVALIVVAARSRNGESN